MMKLTDFVCSRAQSAALVSSFGMMEDHEELSPICSELVLEYDRKFTACRTAAPSLKVIERICQWMKDLDAIRFGFEASEMEREPRSDQYHLVFDLFKTFRPRFQALFFHCVESVMSSGKELAEIKRVVHSEQKRIQRQRIVLFSMGREAQEKIQIVFQEWMLELNREKVNLHELFVSLQRLETPRPIVVSQGVRMERVALDDAFARGRKDLIELWRQRGWVDDHDYDWEMRRYRLEGITCFSEQRGSRSCEKPCVDKALQALVEEFVQHREKTTVDNIYDSLLPIFKRFSNCTKAQREMYLQRMFPEIADWSFVLGRAIQGKLKQVESIRAKRYVAEYGGVRALKREDTTLDAIFQWCPRSYLGILYVQLIEESGNISQLPLLQKFPLTCLHDDMFYRIIFLSMLAGHVEQTVFLIQQAKKGPDREGLQQLLFGYRTFIRTVIKMTDCQGACEIGRSVDPALIAILLGHFPEFFSQREELLCYAKEEKAAASVLYVLEQACAKTSLDSDI